MNNGKNKRYVCIASDSEFHPNEDELIELLNIHKAPDSPRIERENTEIIYDQ